MRILHVTPCYLPGRRYGGPIASVHGLGRALVERGHEVTVFTTDLDGWLPMDPPPGRSGEIDGVHVRYFETSVGKRVHRAPAMRDALRSDVGDFDVVHVHGLFTWPSVQGAREAERAGVPFVLSPRGMLVRDLIQRRGRVRKELWIRAFERRTFETASLIHATSDLEAEELRQFSFARRPSVTIPNGVDAPESLADGAAVSPEVARLAQRDDVVLYVGRVNWKKGLDRLLEAVTSLGRGHLAIAGNDDGYLAELKEAIRARGASDRVTLLGHVDGADKAALFASSRVLALVSHNENFGNVVLEGMAAGLPVVVSHAVGAAPIVAGSGAGVVTSGDPVEIADALERILADDVLARSLGDAGREEVRTRYTWAAVARTFESWYERLAAKARARAA